MTLAIASVDRVRCSKRMLARCAAAVGAGCGTEGLALGPSGPVYGSSVRLIWGKVSENESIVSEAAAAAAAASNLDEGIMFDFAALFP